MTVWRLVIREMLHRKLSFLAGFASVTVAVACLVGSVALLAGHDLQTEAVIAGMEEATKARLAELQEDYRKIVLQLGFNVFIVPKGAQATDVYGNRGEMKEMPEEYAERLAAAGIVTINHLLPSLTAATPWPEQQTRVLLTGIRGEIPLAKKHGGKQPLMQPVESGTMVLGYAIGGQAGLKPGDSARFQGRDFRVARVEPFRGTDDDVTVWLNLADAQKLLGKEGRITAIQAINCLAAQCHPEIDGLPAIDEEIARVLPDTQVLVDMGKAVTRIEARERAASEAEAALQAESRRRLAIRGQIARFASILSPGAVGGAGVWIALAMLVNVRQRRTEIGTLRALGARSPTLYGLFLGKAVAFGLAGAVVGTAVGLIVAARWAGVAIGQLVDPLVLWGTVLGTPVVAATASWIPATVAASQDPATVLSAE